MLGDDYLDADTWITWVADTFFTGAVVVTQSGGAITGTNDDVLYRLERNGVFSYEIPMDVGFVQLHFAETQSNFSNCRQFNVEIEAESIARYDILDASNAVILELDELLVEDGALSMFFIKRPFPRWKIPGECDSNHVVAVVIIHDVVNC